MEWNSDCNRSEHERVTREMTQMYVDELDKVRAEGFPENEVHNEAAKRLNANKQYLSLGDTSRSIRQRDEELIFGDD